MTGRLSSSATNDQLKSDPVVFAKSGNATVAALPERWYNNFDVPVEVLDVRVHASTAPTGASLIADVKKNGTTVFAASGDRATLTATNNRGAAFVPTKTGDAILVRPGDYLTAEFTQVGSTVAGADARVEVRLGRHGRQ